MKNMHKIEVPTLEFILSVIVLSTIEQGQGKARKPESDRDRGTTETRKNINKEL